MFGYTFLLFQFKRPNLLCIFFLWPPAYFLLQSKYYMMETCMLQADVRVHELLSLGTILSTNILLPMSKAKFSVA